MKNTFIFVGIALVAAALSGCESMGWSDRAFRDTFTPGVDAETTVRTWDADGKPHVKEVQSEPAYLYDNAQQEAQK